MKRHDKLAETIPYGTLGILALESSRDMGKESMTILLTGETTELQNMQLPLLSPDTTESHS